MNEYIKRLGFSLTLHVEDYLWKNGKPYGLNGQNKEKKNISYKIVADPYYKRISIEKYAHEIFEGVIYDSAVFDFRHLKPAEQNAWQKTIISEEANKVICHIRNQDDRLVLMEEYTFENDFCRECHSFSPHGVLVSLQKIYYKSFGDPFDGTILYDQNHHEVVYKMYRIDPKTNEFSDLLEEEWDMSKKKKV